jgi:hypothetical protein
MCATLVVSLAAFATPSVVAADAAPVRPFQADFTVRVLEVIQFDPPDPLRWMEEQGGSGNATHMGLSNLSHSLVVDLHQVSNGCFPLTGTGTLVAANGDKLFLTRTGVVCPQPDGTIPGDLPYTITGGTGRFEGATGSGIVHGVFYNGVITERYEGMISY